MSVLEVWAAQPSLFHAPRRTSRTGRQLPSTRANEWAGGGRVASESSTHAGVTIAIARLVADVRVQQPSTQQALSNETRFFQHAGRTDILDIADRANAEYRMLT